MDALELQSRYKLSDITYQINIMINQEIPNFDHYESPRRRQSIELEEAIDQCFKNQRSGEVLNLSSLLHYANCQQTLKLKNLRDKMSVFELKDLVTQLLDMVRTQHTSIRLLLLSYKSQIKIWRQSLMERISECSNQKQSIFVSLKSQICELKQSQENWMRELKQLRTQISESQAKKRQYQQIENSKNKQIASLKSMLKNEREVLRRQMEQVKKDSYKTYQQNFDLQQKLYSIEDQIQQKKEEHQSMMKDKSLQIQKLNNFVESLHRTITLKSKEVADLKQKLAYSKNTVKSYETKNIVNFNKLAESKHIFQFGQNTRKKEKKRDQSLEVSQRSSESAILKISPQTMNYLRPVSNKDHSKQKSLLAPYMVKNDFLSKSLHSSRVCQTQINSPVAQKIQRTKRGSRQKFNFNLIQLQIDKLSDRLQSDLRMTRK